PSHHTLGYTLFPYTTLFRSRQAPGRIAQRHLTHHPGDAAAKGRKIQGEQERAAQRARVRSPSSDRRRSTASPYTASVRSAERSRDRKSTRLNSSHVSISYAV